MILEKWRQYGHAWSLPEDDRRAALLALCSSDVRYEDPNTTLSGIENFIEHMGQFQKKWPGGHFSIETALEHHGNSLAHWRMISGDGHEVLQGTSFSELDADGRFVRFAGFWPAE